MFSYPGKFPTAYHHPYPVERGSREAQVSAQLFRVPRLLRTTSRCLRSVQSLAPTRDTAAGSLGALGQALPQERQIQGRAFQKSHVKLKRLPRGAPGFMAQARFPAVSSTEKAGASQLRWLHVCELCCYMRISRFLSIFLDQAEVTVWEHYDFLQEQLPGPLWAEFTTLCAVLPSTLGLYVHSADQQHAAAPPPWPWWHPIVGATAGSPAQTDPLSCAAQDHTDSLLRHTAPLLSLRDEICEILSPCGSCHHLL